MYGIDVDIELLVRQILFAMVGQLNGELRLLEKLLLGIRELRMSIVTIRLTEHSVRHTATHRVRRLALYKFKIELKFELKSEFKSVQLKRNRLSSAASVKDTSPSSSFSKKNSNHVCETLSPVSVLVLLFQQAFSERERERPIAKLR